MILERLDISADEFLDGTGWEIKPQGACHGDVCVPLPGGFSVETAAERLGMALVPDVAHGLYGLGPATLTGHALASAQAPEVSLPDLDGNVFQLSSLRGQKVVIVAWAPY